MLKTLHIPLRSLLAVAFLLAAAPVSRATYDTHLYDSLLKKIYKNSSDGDAGDIYSLIRKALETNPDEGTDLVDALIKKLGHNLDNLDEGVSKDDLLRVRKKLRRWLRSHPRHTDNHGPVTTPESPTTSG